MTKDEYWQAHVKKNPKLEDEDASVKVKVATLKALMFEAFDKGYDQHRKVSESLREMFKNSGLGNPFGL